MSESNVVAQQPTSPDPEPPRAEPQKKKRGFAAMDREQVRELARRGGAAAHRAGTAHEFTTEEARAAGRKGGHAAHAQPRTPTTPEDGSSGNH